jgi:hypothetical protein
VPGPHRHSGQFLHRKVKGDYLLCHRLRYELAWKGRTGTRSYLIDWCRLPDGTWKVA